MLASVPEHLHHAMREELQLVRLVKTTVEDVSHRGDEGSLGDVELSEALVLGGPEQAEEHCLVLLVKVERDHE